MDNMSKAVKPDGGLFLTSGVWISWSVGDNEITLDGNFTLEQLEFIVAHIKAKQVSKP